MRAVRGVSAAGAQDTIVRVIAKPGLPQNLAHALPPARAVAIRPQKWAPLNLIGVPATRGTSATKTAPDVKV